MKISILSLLLSINLPMAYCIKPAQQEHAVCKICDAQGVCTVDSKSIITKFCMTYNHEFGPHAKHIEGLIATGKNKSACPWLKHFFMKLYFLRIGNAMTKELYWVTLELLKMKQEAYIRRVVPGYLEGLAPYDTEVGRLLGVEVPNV